MVRISVVTVTVTDRQISEAFLVGVPCCQK
jgi:hypothetical protein